MKRWVECFRAENPSDLDERINEYCEKHDLLPVSIAVTKCTYSGGLLYVALVIVETEE